jgi:hypothetical protein
MKKSIYVIQSDKGFLCDVENYTDDIHKAAVFVDYDVAVKKLCAVSGVLTTECTVTTTAIDFPRLYPISKQ